MRSNVNTANGDRPSLRGVYGRALAGTVVAASAARLLARSLPALLALLLLVAPASSSAHGPALHDNFNGRFHYPWFFMNFEDVDGVFTKTPGRQCGIDACASLKREKGDKFLGVSVHPSTTPGIYTNTDVAEVPIALPGAIESGRWNPAVGKPVVLRARIRWNAPYRLDGTGTAVGTSGLVLWNSPVDEDGPMENYDQIGFTWITHRAMGGFLSGLTGSAIVNFTPLAPVRPPASLNLHKWMKVKLVWSVDVHGVQRVEYFINGDSLGVIVLPEPLRNLSVEIWNDNQEPTLTPDGLINEFPAPPVEQSFEIDYVKVSGGAPAPKRRRF